MGLCCTSIFLIGVKVQNDSSKLLSHIIYHISPSPQSQGCALDMVLDHHMRHEFCPSWANFQIELEIEECIDEYREESVQKDVETELADTGCMSPWA